MKIGFALCGSFCTFSKVIPVIKTLSKEYEIYPIMSPVAFSTDTRFGSADEFVSAIEEICKKPVISTISGAEPIGPKKLLDALIIAPTTGNTLAKLALGITDTSVTMAAKAHLRNSRPLIIAPSTNDGLFTSAKNIGLLQSMKNIYFVPYSQDDAQGKPASLVSHMDKIPDTLKCALDGIQIQPILA